MSPVTWVFFPGPPPGPETPNRNWSSEEGSIDQLLSGTIAGETTSATLKYNQKAETVEWLNTSTFHSYDDLSVTDPIGVNLSGTQTVVTGFHTKGSSSDDGSGNSEFGYQVDTVKGPGVSTESGSPRIPAAIRRGSCIRKRYEDRDLTTSEIQTSSRQRPCRHQNDDHFAGEIHGGQFSQEYVRTPGSPHSQFGNSSSDDETHAIEDENSNNHHDTKFIRILPR